MPHDPPFRELLAQAKSGDGVAIDRLLARVHPHIRRLVESRVGERLLRRIRRSDVLQNTWLEVIRGLPRFDGDDEDDFSGWVATVLEHQIHHADRFFRAKKRTAPERSSEARSFARRFLKTPASPSSQAASSEELRVVSQSLAELPELYRRVIVAAVIEGRPHKEVARDLGRSESATRMLLCRARAALMLAIESRESPPDDGARSR